MTKGKFYITTAIDYVNANPHIGTAYEKIAADFLARAKRLAGYDVCFLMGADEHSVNVAREAASRGLAPLAYCDQMEARFRSVWEHLDISYDDFIRTTQPRHHQAVQALFAAVHAAGDIYKGAYKGYYCDSCEAFLQAKDLVDGKCPTHKREPRWLEEENYFFALSRFGPPLLQHIQEHPEFIQPEMRRNEILKVIEGGLEDVSRVAQRRRMGHPAAARLLPRRVRVVRRAHQLHLGARLARRRRGATRRYWPADLHVIGKDITRFHCLIWPAMLMAAGLPLPRTVWGHGFVTVNGEKLSKSLGNIIAPETVTERFGVDGFRYLFLKEVPLQSRRRFLVADVQRALQRRSRQRPGEPHRAYPGHGGALSGRRGAGLGGDAGPARR